MAHQAVLNQHAAAPPGPNGSNGSNGLMDGVGSLGSDLAALATLQGKLAAADARESAVKAAPGLAGLALGVLLAFAGTVTILGGLALWISEDFHVRLPFALMLVGLGSLVLVAVLAVLGLKLIGSSLGTFRRSAEELERNLAWVKTTLTHSGR